MNNTKEILIDIFAVSGCFWVLYYLYSHFVMKGFIVKRYKNRTGLINTIYFKKHATFVRYLPDFLSAGFFAIHLLMFVWGWKIISYIKEQKPNVKYFDDIEHPGYVTRNFSGQEIRRAKWVFISGIILFAHGVAYYIFRFIWPDVFN